jgi:hypothetical protein
MRQSGAGGFILWLVIFSLGVLALYLFQSAWLAMIQYLLNSSQSSALPISTVVVPTFTFPKVIGPVSPGREAMVGNLGITVTRVISPADSYMGKAAFPAVALEGKEYLAVDVTVRCFFSAEKCHLTESDFGVETKDGQVTPAELSGDYSDVLQGVFEGGDVQPGKSLSGSLFFIIPKGEIGMKLIYPRMYSFGNSVEFLLGK